MTGLEPVTFAVKGQRSNQLSYTSIIRAESEIRTRNSQLGRMVVYQLTYFCLCSGGETRTHVNPAYETGLEPPPDHPAMFVGS